VIVGVSGPQPTNVTFNFADSAGNKASLSTSELFILGINNETAPNYWTISTECSPAMLDRQTLSVFEHPVYCRLKMSSTNSKAEPITVQGPDDFYTECTGAMEYISDMSIENNYAKSREPFIALSLVSTDYAINNMSFSCPLKTLTRVGNFMAQNFETDNATVNLQFYNLPLGELYNNMDDDIEDVEDSINGVWKVIGQLQTFIGYAEKLCQILNMIMNVISILSAVSLLTDIVGEVLEKIPFVSGAGTALKTTSGKLCDVSEKSREWLNSEDSGLLKTLNKFCDFITCRAGLFDLVGKKEKVQEYSTDQYMEFISLGDDWTKSQIQGSIGGEKGAQNPSVYLNIKDSLVMSIIVPPLCIPGIIYNLDKWRQIQCRYGLCLLEDVRQNGMPVSVCKDQKSYMQCRFVVGEIFNLVPFAPLLNYWINTLQNIISDPLVLLATIANFVFNCQQACDTGEGINYAICAGMSIASELGHTVNTIKSFKSVADFGSVSQQWCEEFKDAKDDYESETNA
jgi:hypothetical protein